MNPLIAKIKYQGNGVMLVAIGSCFAVHIVTFLPITCIYYIVTLAENCMFESFLGVSHFYIFTRFRLIFFKLIDKYPLG